MQVSALCIKIVVFAAEEEHGTAEVDHYADTGNNGNNAPGNRLRMLYALHGLYTEYAYSNEQHYCIGQGSQHCRFFITVGKSIGRFAACQPVGHQRQTQADHIAEVMTGIGEERNRTGEETGTCLHYHKQHIEHDAGHKGIAYLLPAMMMMVVMVVTMPMLPAAAMTVPVMMPSHILALSYLLFEP